MNVRNALKMLGVRRFAAVVLLCVGMPSSGQVVELIDGSFVWSQFADDALLEQAKDPAVRPSSQPGRFAPQAMGFAAATAAVTPPGVYVPQEAHGIYTQHGGIAVSPQSGSYRVETTDFMLPGVGGYDFALRRRYDPVVGQDDQSTDPAFDPADWHIGDSSYRIGHGWRLELPYLRIHKQAETTTWGHPSNPRERLINVSLPSGASYRLHDLAYNAGESSIRVYENFFSRYFRVIYDGSQSATPYRLVMADGTYYVFDTVGRVVEINGWADGHRADRIQISYNGSGHINQISGTGPNEWSATFGPYTADGLISGITITDSGSNDVVITYTQTDALLDSVTVTGGSGAAAVTRDWVYSYASTELQKRSGDTTTTDTFSYLQSVTDPEGSVSTITGTTTQQMYTTKASGQVDPLEYWSQRLLITDVEYQERRRNQARTQLEQLVTRRANYEYRRFDNHQSILLPATIGEVWETLTDVLDGRHTRTDHIFAFDSSGTAYSNHVDQQIVRDVIEATGQFNGSVESRNYNWSAAKFLSDVVVSRDPRLSETTAYVYDTYGNQQYRHTFRLSSRGATHDTITQVWTRYWGAPYTLDGSSQDVGQPGDVTSLYPERARWRAYPYPAAPQSIVDWYLPVNLPVQQIVAGSVPQYNEVTGVFSDLSANNTEQREYRHSAYRYDPVSAHLTGSGECVAVSQSQCNQWATVERTYVANDEVHRVEEIRNPGGLTTRFSYVDPADNTLTPGVYEVTTTAEATGPVANTPADIYLDAQNSSNTITTVTGYDGLTMQPVWTMDGRGYVTEYRRDAFGRTVQMVLPDVDSGNDLAGTTPGQAGFAGPRSDNHTITIQIDDQNLTREVSQTVAGVLRRQMTYYNSGGSVERTIAYAASGNAVTDIWYNGAGLPTLRIDPINSSAGNGPQTAFSYDRWGSLVRVDYADGTSSTMSYDYSSGAVTSVDQRGYATVMGYSVDGRLEQIKAYVNPGTGGLAREQRVYTDGWGAQRYVVDPLDNVTQYHMNQRGLLAQITYPVDGNIPFYENGNVAVQAGGNDPTVPYVRFEYDIDGYRTAQIVNAPGTNAEQRVEFTVDELGRVVIARTDYTDHDLAGAASSSATAKSTYRYDAAGNVISVINPRHAALATPPELRFAYSPRGQILSETDQLGNVRTQSYHADGQVHQYRDPRQAVAATEYPGFSGDFITTWEYDDLGRLERVIQPLAVLGGARPTTQYSYFPAGNLQTLTSPQGAVATIDYTPRGWPERTTVTGGAHLYTTTNLYDEVGNLVQTTGPGGSVSSAEYDGWGRVVRTVSPENAVQSFLYDDGDRLTQATDANGIDTNYVYTAYGQIHTVTLAANTAGPETTTYWYDRQGNLTQMTDPTGRNLTYSYDERGLRISQHETTLGPGAIYRFAYDATGNMDQALDPNGTLASYSYDDLSRPEAISMVNGTTIKSIAFGYDEAGFRWEMVDDGVTTRYNDFGTSFATPEYRPDPYGRINRESTTFGGSTYHVGYSYNLDGQVTGITTPSGHPINYTYNPLGELEQVSEFITTNIGYNAQGLRSSMSLTNGTTVQWNYDLAGRLLTKTDAGPGGTIGQWNFVYDDVGNIVWKNDTYYTYDDVGRLTREVRSQTFSGPVAGAEVDTATGDLFGDATFGFALSDTTLIPLDTNATSVGVDLDPTGGTTTTVERIVLTPQATSHRVTGDTLRVYTASDAGQTYTEQQNWHARTLSDGSIEIVFDGPAPDARFVKVRSTHDERDADLNAVDNSEFVNTAGDIVEVHESTTIQAEDGYQYDQAGNRVVETETDPVQGTQTYTSSYYADGQSQRLRTNGDTGANGRFGFLYDANGNMTGRGTFYNPGTPGTEEIVLDTTQGEHWSYQWDLANRLTSVEHNGAAAASYTYSGRGLRVQKTAGTDTTIYVYDLWGQVIYERTSPTEYRDYVFAFGRHLGRIDGTIAPDGTHTPTPGQQYYYHTDHLGTVEAVTDATGSGVWQASYNAFGEVLGQSGTLDQAPLYTGKAYDADVQLYYYNARWMDPALGRFINEDPARDGLNWYAYVNNSPLLFTDPTGMYDDHDAGYTDTYDAVDDGNDDGTDTTSGGNCVNCTSGVGGGSTGDGDGSKSTSSGTGTPTQTAAEEEEAEWVYGPSIRRGNTSSRAILRAPGNSTGGSGNLTDGVPDDELGAGTPVTNGEPGDNGSTDSGPITLTGTGSRTSGGRDDWSRSTPSDRNNDGPAATDGSDVADVTLGEIIESDPTFYNQDTFTEGQRFYLAWFHGSDVPERLGNHCSYVIFSLNRMARRGCDVSAMTVAEVDAINRRYTGIQSAVNIAAIAHSLYHAGRPTPLPPGRPTPAFTRSAARHMANPARRVPVQILDDIIRTTPGFPDPRGTPALMHYSRITRNSRLYNLEVLHHEMTNTIQHFRYRVGPLGPLPPVR